MKQAFTLIELLVVVLIIGILASIALPQYQKAVLKSRVTKALIALQALDQAQRECFLATGKYCTADALSVSVNTTCYSYDTSASCSGGDLQINDTVRFGWKGLNKDSGDIEKGQIQWSCVTTGGSKERAVCRQYYTEWNGTEEAISTGYPQQYSFYGAYH